MTNMNNALGIRSNSQLSDTNLPSGPSQTESPPPSSKAVLWDQNFREWTEGKPLTLAPQDLKYLEAAVWNDTLLLSGQSLVDYSLLLAAAPAEGLDASILQSAP